MKKRQLLVRVQTFGRESVEPEQERTIDYTSPGARTWLAKHCYWAMHNDKGVATFPVLEEDGLELDNREGTSQ